MNRLFVLLCILSALSACSQQSVERAGYKTGRAAAAVAEGAERAYDATVDTSVSTYEQMKRGYKHRREEEEQRRYEPHMDDEDTYY